MKAIARLSFLFITALWGSFYAITKEVLGHIDPVLFTFFEVLTLLPVAVLLIAMNWREVDRTILKRGCILGSFLGLAMLIMTVSLQFTAASSTAFFPAMSGVLGALITGGILKRPLSRGTWLAGGLSLIGVCIILMTSGTDIEVRGNLIAILGACFFTVYIFIVDSDKKRYAPQKQGEDHFWPILGIEYLTLIGWMSLIALLFGDWRHLRLIFPGDIEVIVYVGLGATFLPYVLSMFMQTYLDPLEVSFLSILEPVWASLIASLCLGETLPLPLYIGGACIITGSVVHVWSTSGYAPLRSGIRLSLLLPGRYAKASNIVHLVYPLLLISAGVLLLNWLGGSLLTLWHDVSHLGPDLQILISQRQETAALLLIGHTFSWLVAWSALALIGILMALSAAHRCMLESREETYKDLSRESTRGAATRRLASNERGLAIVRRRTTGLLAPDGHAHETLRRTASKKLTSPVAQRRQIAREQRKGDGGEVFLSKMRN